MSMSTTVSTNSTVKLEFSLFVSIPELLHHKQVDVTTVLTQRTIRSTIERGRGRNKFVPVLRGNGTKIAPIGDTCVQPPGEMSWVRGKLADRLGDHAVLTPEEIILVTFSGTELSHPRPSQSLNNSNNQDYAGYTGPAHFRSQYVNIFLLP